MMKNGKSDRFLQIRTVIKLSSQKTLYNQDKEKLFQNLKKKIFLKSSPVLLGRRNLVQSENFNSTIEKNNIKT